MKKEWISLGIHQGERTFERCDEIIRLLSKQGIPCGISKCPDMFIPFKTKYYVHVPDWKTWHIVIDHLQRGKPLKKRGAQR